MSLTPPERETHIWYNEDEDTTKAETSIRTHLTKLRKSGLRLVGTKTQDGDDILWRFEGKGDLMQFPREKIKRNISEEARAAASERLRNMARGRKDARV